MIMARLRINLRTDFRPDDIDSIDIHVMYQGESIRSIVIVNLPDDDLVRGVRLATFEGLPDGEEVALALRIFFKDQSPNSRSRAVDYRLGDRECSGRWFWRTCRPSNNVYDFVIPAA